MIDSGEIIKASVLSVLSIFFYSAIAIYLVRFKFVDSTSGQVLGRLTLALFLPLLLVDEISRNANESTISAMWIVPLFDALCLFIGVAVAFLFIRLTRRNAHIRRTLVSLISTTNVTAIPLHIISKFLCSTCSLASLKAANLATTLMGVGSLSTDVYIWGFLFVYLAAETKQKIDDNGESIAATSTTSMPTVSNSVVVVDEKMPLQHEHESSTDDVDRPITTRNFAHRRRLQTLKDFLFRFLSAPFLATVLGLFIGLISPLRMLFHRAEGADLTTVPPLYFVVDLIVPAARAAVTSLLLVVGFAFARLTSIVPRESDNGLSRIDVVGVCLCRLIVVPGIMFLIILALFGDGSDALPLTVTPTAIFVSFIQSMTPSSIACLIIAQDLKSKVTETSILMFYLHLFSLITMPIWLVLISNLCLNYGMNS